MSDVDRTPFDDFLEELGNIHRGFASPLDPTTVEMVVHILGFVFVATHAEMRRRYTPVVPKSSLDQDLMQWTIRNLQYFLKQLPLDNVPLTAEQISTIDAILKRHAQAIERLLQTKIEDWPLLYP